MNYKTALPNTLIIAHVLPWFGDKSHRPIGYDSRDWRTCDRQLAQMRAFGIGAVNVDWYGPGNQFLNTATIAMMAACERAGMGFSLCLDGNAINADAIAYAQRTFLPSPAYLRSSRSGAPMVSVFNGLGGPVALPHEIDFIFRNSGAFTLPGSAGAFGWVEPRPGAPGDPNKAYLADFAHVAAVNPGKTAWFPIYRGFDDTSPDDPQKNVWGGQARMMSARGGQTERDCIAAIPAGAAYALVVTWNDWEEGTAIEPWPTSA